MGYIYIFTNPSFPQYVKIGFAQNVEQRLDELNRSTAVPFAFRIYATYQVDSDLSDKKLHSILDKLDPSLRTTETINGKNRVREFYAMSPETAYDILEAIADINNFHDRLNKHTESSEEKADEKAAQEIAAAHIERAKPFYFSMCNIKPGEQITFACRGNQYDGTVVTVVDDKHVSYNGEVWSLSYLARFFRQSKYVPQGPTYFKYKNEFLNDIRERNEKA